MAEQGRRGYNRVEVVTDLAQVVESEPVIILAGSEETLDSEREDSSKFESEADLELVYTARTKIIMAHLHGILLECINLPNGDDLADVILHVNLAQKALGMLENKLVNSEI